MPKVSKQSAAHIENHGPVIEAYEDFDGYRIQFLTFNIDADATPLLKGLPGDSCTARHWGYVTKGKLTFTVDGQDEVYEPGDAFYIAPGHTQRAEAGTEYVQFSPAKELQVVSDTMMRNMQQMMSA
jgi:quercetin dioxygenase-like cupin family protein